MKIMTTNRISDKCIFPYVNNKRLLRRKWRLGSHRSRTVLSLCSECALSHSGSSLIPLFIHTIKNVDNALHVFSCVVHTLKYISDCSLWVHVFRFSLCILLPPPINNLHKTCTYLQHAGGLFLMGCAHTRTVMWIFLQSQCDKMGGKHISTCSIYQRTFNRMALKVTPWHSSSNSYQPLVFPDRHYEKYLWSVCL